MEAIRKALGARPRSLHAEVPETVRQTGGGDLLSRQMCAKPVQPPVFPQLQRALCSVVHRIGYAEAGLARTNLTGLETVAGALPPKGPNGRL